MYLRGHRVWVLLAAALGGLVACSPEAKPQASDGGGRGGNGGSPGLTDAGSGQTGGTGQGGTGPTGGTGGSILPGAGGAGGSGGGQPGAGGNAPGDSGAGGITGSGGSGPATDGPPALPLVHSQLLSVNYGHSCAVTPAGLVKCWGLNQFGQLGNNMPNTGDTQGRVPTSTPVTASVVTGTAINVAVGRSNTCVRLADMTISCFGFNAYGTLGNGTTQTAASAQKVLGISDALIVRGGEPTMCAVLSNHTVKCWGNNGWGQVGDGTTMDRSTPVLVAGLTDVVDVAIGWRSTCALLMGGTIKCWGNNEAGQLGNGSMTSSRMPVTVTGISNATAINGVGYAAACALLGDKTVRCWGINERGQLGNGTSQPSTVPVAVPGINDAIGVATGAESACALVTGGKVKCWGEFVSRNTAVEIAGVAGATAISVGKMHACAVLDDLSLRCWGSNEYGQLGNGMAQSSAGGVRVLGIP
jgi:alpha-tubulin suppressor-like RCC1 family protein